ncbi:MAG: hypothetical protein U1E91_01405 [Moraxella sp.]
MGNPTTWLGEKMVFMVILLGWLGYQMAAGNADISDTLVAAKLLAGCQAAKIYHDAKLSSSFLKLCK